MRVMYIDNDGAGFADFVEIEGGQTVGQFLAIRKGTDFNPKDHTIRVNRLPAAADQVLQEDDRISVVPSKIAGA